MKWVWILPFLMAAMTDRLRAEDKVSPDFNRDVRTILAGHCFRCHGPDAARAQKPDCVWMCVKPRWP